MLTRRSATVYVLLAVAWTLIATWQVLEHSRTRVSARAALRNRARDISNSVGVVIRSQRRFGGFVEQPRLEAALKELTTSDELRSVALLNSAGEVTASAGDPIELDIENLLERGEHWTRNTVTVGNLVDLGPGAQQDEGTPSATIVLTPPGSDHDADGDGPPPDPGPPPPFFPLDEKKFDAILAIIRGDALDEEKMEALRSMIPSELLDEEKLERLRAMLEDGELDEEEMRGVARLFRPGRPGERGRGRRGRPFFRRPPGMNEERYQELVEKQGVHAFVLTMSTDAFRAESARDFWPRIALAGIALVAVVGLGVAWHNLERSSALQMRLLRASELNLHLQEMNVAAAGLAHETRNPLNTIRGLAQMVSKHADVSPEIRGKSREITEEVDRVTGRLNQFIDYSRPPEVRPAPTNIKAVVGDVASALETDIEDKQIQFEMTGPELTVEADESLLRQVIFNLLLNSIQAVDREGMIEVLLEKTGPDEASIEVRDNGPGVPDHAREEVFRPYFTTSEEGTGLGLAVVRQLVLAHQWELAYIPGDAGGARFRVTGLKLT
jgi:signal transduction histidine kinase